MPFLKRYLITSPKRKSKAPHMCKHYIFSLFFVYSFFFNGRKNTETATEARFFIIFVNSHFVGFRNSLPANQPQIYSMFYIHRHELCVIYMMRNETFFCFSILMYVHDYCGIFQRLYHTINCSATILSHPHRAKQLLFKHNFMLLHIVKFVSKFALWMETRTTAPTTWKPVHSLVVNAYSYFLLCRVVSAFFVFMVVVIGVWTHRVSPFNSHSWLHPYYVCIFKTDTIMWATVCCAHFTKLQCMFSIFLDNLLFCRNTARTYQIFSLKISNIPNTRAS